MRAADTQGRREALEASVERLRWQADAAGFDAEQRARSVVLREELATAEAELAALAEAESRLAPVAPFAGRLRDLQPELAPGVAVAKNEKLAVLVGEGAYEVDTYLGEEEVQRVAVGDRARFYPDGLEGPFVELEVSAIDRDAAHVLPSGVFAAQLGGTVPARGRQDAWIPEHAVYHVTLTLRQSPGELDNRTWRGKVVIAGDWEAPGLRFLKAAAAVAWREMGF